MVDRHLNFIFKLSCKRKKKQHIFSAKHEKLHTQFFITMWINVQLLVFSMDSLPLCSDITTHFHNCSPKRNPTHFMTMLCTVHNHLTFKRKVLFIMFIPLASILLQVFDMSTWRIYRCTIKLHCKDFQINENAFRVCLKGSVMKPWGLVYA